MLEGPADVDQLVHDGITHVADFQMHRDDASLFIAAHQIHYLWNPCPDDGAHKEAWWFEKTLDFVLADIRNPNTKYYLHCHRGLNRGPSQTYAVMRALSFPAQLAETLIRTARPKAELAYKYDAEQALHELGYT